MKSTKIKNAAIVFITLAAFSGLPVKAQILGINFYDSANGGQQTLTSTDLVGAGAGSSTGWYNNIDVSTTAPTGVVLTDSTGSATAAQVTFTQGTAANGKSSIFWPPSSGTQNSTSTSLTPTQKLYNGNLGGLNDNFTVELALNSIPYESYAIYLYVASDQFRSGETQLFSAPGTQVGSTYYYTAGGSFPLGDNLPTSYIQATSTDSTSPTSGANFALYSGLTGSTQYIDFTPVNSGIAWIAGIEIVNTTSVVPEPSTWVLMFAGLTVLVIIQRRGSRIG